MQPIVLQPVHDVVLGKPGDWRLDSVAFAADGRLYAEVSEASFNLWAILVYYWPEVLGAVLGLAALWLAWSWLRVARRPQTPGGLHCRGCGYDRSGLPPKQACPECGVDPQRRRPVVGRGSLRRLAAPLIALPIAGVTYGGLHLGRVPRQGSLGDLFSWESPRLAALAVEKKIGWLQQHGGRLRRLVQVDPVKGSIARTVRRLAPNSGFRLSISPDGRTAVTTLWEGELAAIDLASGRVRRREARRDAGRTRTGQWSPTGWKHAAGWLTPDTVCVQFIDAAAVTNEVYSWNVANGELARLTDASIRSAPGIPEAGLLYLAPQSLTVVEVPGRSIGGGSRYGAQSTLKVRDLSKGGEVKAELTDAFWGGVTPVFGARGEEFFIRGWGGPGILQYPMTGRGFPNAMREPGFMGTLQDGPAGLAYHAPTQRLFVATSNPEAVHVRQDGSWIGRLDFGIDALPDDYIAVSPDGRWVCIAAVEVSGTLPVPGPGAPGSPPFNPASVRFKSHFLVFDTDTLPGGRRGEEAR